MDDELDPPLDSMTREGWWQAWRSCNADRKALEADVAVLLAACKAAREALNEAIAKAYEGHQ